MQKAVTLILSSLFSLFLIIGTSFKLYNSFELIINNILLSVLAFIILVFILYRLISKIYNLCDNYTQTKDIKIFKHFQNRPLLTSFIFINMCWLIYVIAIYPCILSPDPSHQILQYFGIDNKYSYYSVLLDENMIITNHHPVMHTLLLGTCAKIGAVIGSINLGLFLYSIIQILVLSLILSYTIAYMKKLNISVKYRLICLLIYSFVPVFPLYALSPVKDVIFGSLIILYIITLSNLIIFKEKITLIKGIKIFTLLILLILFRNNGIHIIILSLPLLFLIKWKENKKILILFISVLIFYTSYQNIILPYFKVTNSSIRETLSIPFQQTARLAKYHEDKITEEEKKSIDKVLNYKTLKDRYNPKKADPVKNEFNKYSTKEDLQDYFKAWLSGFKKSPGTYISATINNTYGYFYPLDKNWYIYYRYNETLRNNNLDYHYNDLYNLRNILTQYGKAFPDIPVLGLLVNIGFGTWILLLMTFYLIKEKKYKEIIIYMPALIVLLVCVASPVNTYFRYALPNIFGMPLMIGIFLSIIKKEGVNNEK